MLTALDICLFLMWYNSSYTALADSETIFLYNHIKQLILRGVIAPLGKFDF